MKRYPKKAEPLWGRRTRKHVTPTTIIYGGSGGINIGTVSALVMAKFALDPGLPLTLKTWGPW